MRRRWIVAVRTVIGIGGAIVFSVLLVIGSGPQQRPWSVLIVVLLAVGCGLAIYNSRRRRSR